MDLAIFIVGLLLFFSSPSNMSHIFIHILHPARGIVGFLAKNRIP